MLSPFDIDNDKPLFLIHWAAIVSIKTKYDKRLYDVNVNGTKNVADLTLEKKGKLAYISSVHDLAKVKANSVVKETK